MMKVLEAYSDAKLDLEPDSATLEVETIILSIVVLKRIQREITQKDSLKKISTKSRMFIQSAGKSC